MRTIKELLQVMLDKQPLFVSGLCSWASLLRVRGYINGVEWLMLDDYINNNRPSPPSSLDALIHINSGFYWKRGDIRPRIKWLKKHIAKN